MVHPTLLSKAATKVFSEDECNTAWGTRLTLCGEGKAPGGRPKRAVSVTHRQARGKRARPRPTGARGDGDGLRGEREAHGA